MKNKISMALISRHIILLSFFQLLLVHVVFVDSELHANNDGQACLQGSNEEAESCGTRHSDAESSSSHAAASTSGPQRKGSADAPEWSEPLVSDSAGRQCSGSCRRLPPACLSCRFNTSCVYGANVTALCRPARGVTCTGRNESFPRELVCAYCYQTPAWQHDCSLCDASVVHKTPGRKYYRANCTVAEDVLCMGNRTFYKRLVCKWTKGDRWSTALTLSVILGGFGVDRFYLGHWQEAIGKFFSFGGLGVWTLIDVILIAIGYLGPADGSLYIT